MLQSPEDHLAPAIGRLLARSAGPTSSRLCLLQPALCSPHCPPLRFQTRQSSVPPQDLALGAPRARSAFPSCLHGWLLTCSRDPEAFLTPRPLPSGASHLSSRLLPPASAQSLPWLEEECIQSAVSAPLLQLSRGSLFPLSSKSTWHTAGAAGELLE